MGYPSIPTYTVDEWFDSMSKSGGFGAGNAKKPPKNYTIGGEEDDRQTQRDENENEDSLSEQMLEQQRQTLIQRDEWRDGHRRGWGNTYNKG